MKKLNKIIFIAFMALIVIQIPQKSLAQQIKPKIKTEIQQDNKRYKKEKAKRNNKHILKDKYPRPIENNDFNTIYNIVKRTSFDSGKTDIIRVACINNNFSSKQCASLLSLFSFDDNKLKALKIMKPRLTDNTNYSKILKLFTFSSNKDKAATILLQ